MMEILRWNPGVLAAGSTGGDEEGPGQQGITGGSLELKARRTFSNRCYSAMSAPPDSQILRGPGETIDDGLRAVGRGEHSPVFFGFQFHTMICEPRDGVGRLPAVKRTEEVFVSAWVVFCELPGLETIMGNVATAAAGDANLRQYFGALFENEDI